MTFNICTCNPEDRDLESIEGVFICLNCGGSVSKELDEDLEYDRFAEDEYSYIH